MEEILQQIQNSLADKSDTEKISFLNELKNALISFSPLHEPVDAVIWVPIEDLQANAYNPNKVASTEMQLLYESIATDGYTQPLVAYCLPDGKYEIVDGFHRFRVGREYKDIKERVQGYLPVVVIDKPLDERMGSTIRHNWARGTHQIRSIAEIVVSLVKDGWSDEKIIEKLGMSRDEVLRLKQVSGLKEAFANHEFSKLWEEFENRYFAQEKADAGKTIAKKPKRSSSKNSTKKSVISDP